MKIYHKLFIRKEEEEKNLEVPRMILKMDQL